MSGRHCLTASMATLVKRELVPFAAAIEAGVDSILTAHVVAGAVDDAPVSVSRFWADHLRAMGFDGAIITDALDMDAVAEGRGIAGVADAAVRALGAGADFLCLGSNFDDSMTSMVIDRIVAAIDAGQLDRTELATQPRPHRTVAPGAILSHLSHTVRSRGRTTRGRAGNRR